MYGRDISAGAFTPQANSGGTPATSTSTPATIGPFGPAGAPATKVRLMASTSTFVSVGAAPTAAATDACLAPNFPEIVLVPAGQKISYLAQTTAGTLNWSVLQ